MYPAGRAALYTMKPTIGLISQAGIVPISRSFDSAGPMAKTPYDLAVVLDAIIERKSDMQENSYTCALTNTWDDISVATLDPEAWKFPSDSVKPVDEATAQIVCQLAGTNSLLIIAKTADIRSAYSRIKMLAKNYKGNVSLVSPEEFNRQGQNSELVVTSDQYLIA